MHATCGRHRALDLFDVRGRHEERELVGESETQPPVLVRLADENERLAFDQMKLLIVVVVVAVVFHLHERTQVTVLLVLVVLVILVFVILVV